MKKTAAILLLSLACAGGAQNGESGDVVDDQPTGFEPPVVTNPESPIAFPPELFDAGVEGMVTLRLFVDEQGVVFPDSAAIVESSGYGALDTAALEGVSQMQFSPALQDGVPIASTFLQPVEFKNTETSGNSDNQ